MNHSERPAAGPAGVTVVGCGYTGRRLLDICRDANRDVLGTVRSEESLAHLRTIGAAAEILDLDAPGGKLPGDWTLDRAVIYMAPPPDAGESDPRLRSFLRRLSGTPTALVYLSTTAVYGDTGGATVDEETPPAPASARGLRRRDAEVAVLEWGRETGVPVRILRVPGIYGPGRLPLERIRQGAPVVRAAEAGPGNRIHVDDLAAVSLAAADYSGSETVFNVGDGSHASMSEYFRGGARAAGLPEPPELPLDELLARVTPAMRGFLAEKRRVATTRMRDELGFRPRYARLEDGVTASLAASD
jgi:nucleoside-diphosphate-sugar epimerase